MKTMEKRSVMLHNLENARAVILQSDWETLYFIVFPKVLPVRSSPSELLVGNKCSGNIQQVHRRAPMPK